MAVYGISLYGISFYGTSSLPTSDPWDVFDFCEPTDATMLTIMAYAEVDSARTFVAPQYSFNGANDLCLYSDDDADSGIIIETPVTPTYSLQFTILPTALPSDFSSLANERFFVAAYNQFGYMTGLLLSENGGLALASDGSGTDFRHLVDSADLFDEGAAYYTFRVTVNGDTGRMNVYVTPTTLVPVIGHQLKITTTAQETPAGTPDGILIEVYGSSANPTNVCFDCLRFSSKEVIPNARPVADPGLDQTSNLYKYAAFDGRSSYDPEGSYLRYWWTITGAPENSELWLTGFGTTPSDASGYTNRMDGTAGDFDDVSEGDLLFLEDQYSVVKYVPSDTSYAIVVDHVFTAGVSTASWSALKQSAWEGTWNPSSIVQVLERTDTEPIGPFVNDTYLVGDNPVGNPTWVVGDAGKIAVWNSVSWTITAQTVGTIVYSIADVMNYRLVDTGPYNWTEDDPEPWELSHWSGRIFEIGTMLPDTSGLYTVELVVNDGTSMILPPKSASIDGSLNSVSAEVILNVSPTGAPLGIVPDMSFIWDYLSNFWSLPAGREMMNTVWSAAAQILAGDMLELWQHDYAKGLFDIQRLFQRRWLGYDFFYEEPNFDDSDYQAVLDTTVDLSGYSATPGLNEYSYDLGATASSLIQSGHMLVLNGQSYEIARTAGNIIVTRDPLPLTTNARVYADNATATFVNWETVTGGTSGATGTVTDGGWNYLELDSPTGPYTTGETITGSSSGATAVVIGYTPAYNQRPRFWQVRPTATSKSTDFTLQVAQQADTALFDVEDADLNDRVRVGCYVYAGRGSKLSFDPTLLATYFADPDRYTVRLFGLVRRNYIPVDDLVLDLSSLQEVVDVDNVEDAPAVLIGNNDFIVEQITSVDDREIQVVNLLESYMERKDYGFDGDTTSAIGKYFDSPSSDFTVTLGAVGTDLSNFLLWVNGENYRLLSVTSATRLELAEEALTTGESDLQWRVFECGDPPDFSWAEITYLDNRPTIESNFGSRVGFTLDDLENRTDNLDYLSAVQGLWYAFWNGPTINNLRTACQVLLGLPFAESSGTVTDIRTPFNTSQNRVLVQDEGDEVIVRSYKFPVELSVAVNPDTGVAYVVGDSIEQFSPICTGVVVEDYISNPTWAENVIGSGDLHEAQKVHTFGVTIESDAFNATNILYMIGYIVRLTAESTPHVKPHYTYPMFIVSLDLEDTIDVQDAFLKGPAFPPEKVLSPGTYYTYPANGSWRAGLATPVPAGWLTSPAYPPSDNWSTIPIYDSTTRWPNDRFTDVPPRQVDYGGLHVEDVSGSVPDPWSGSWPQVPAPLAGGTHSSTPAEGTFRWGDTDEAGHYIHVYGTSETNLLSDEDMESRDYPGVGVSPWDLANYGGSSHALTAVKSSAQAHSATKSVHITSIGPSLGIEQVVTVTAGRQVAADLWLYFVSGQVHVELYDDTTQVAEWRFISPPAVWTKVTLHHWKATDTNYTLRILTGPAGGEFYVDDAGVYSDAVPWAQWGHGMMYIGRTGGYTFGGLPDEDLEFTLHT